MTALFLRYCWRCNSTQTAADRSKGGLVCGCGAQLRIVDAHALIPAMGREMTEDERRTVVESLRGYDQPA